MWVVQLRNRFFFIVILNNLFFSTLTRQSSFNFLFTFKENLIKHSGFAAFHFFDSLQTCSAHKPMCALHPFLNSSVSPAEISLSLVGHHSRGFLIKLLDVMDMSATLILLMISRCLHMSKLIELYILIIMCRFCVSIIP